MHFYPPIQPSLLTKLLNLLRFLTATFICAMWIVQNLLHLTVSSVKTKLHASSFLCCRVLTPSLLLPLNSMDLTRVHCSSYLVQISHTFSCKVCGVWEGTTNTHISPKCRMIMHFLDRFGMTSLGFN